MTFSFVRVLSLNVNCFGMGFLPQLIWNFIDVSRDGGRGESGKGLCSAPSVLLFAPA